MRYRHAYEDDYMERPRGGGQMTRLLFALGMVIVVLVLALILPAAISGYAHNWAGIGASVGTLMVVAPWVIFALVAIWGVLQVYYAWRGHPIHAKQDRFPAVMSPSGRIVQVDNQQPRFAQVRTYSPREERQMLPAPEVIEEEEEEPVQALRPVPWQAIVTQIPPGQLPLGVGVDGRLRTGPRDRLKTCLTLGKSGSGKTISVAGRLTAAAQSGSLLVVIDPHFHKEDSLSKKIAPLAPAFWQGLPIAVEVEDILGHLALVQEEFLARKQSGLLSPELIVVVEEYSTLYDDPDVQEPLVKLSKDLARQARGYGIYGEFLTQDMSGGMAGRIRRLAQSYVIGRLDYNDAQAILHDSKLANQVMTLPQGAALVVDAYGERELLQQPYITRADIEEAGRRLPQPEWQIPPLSSIMKPGRSLGDAERVSVREPEKDPSDPKITVLRPTHTLTHKASRVTSEQRQFILEKTAAGKSPSAIAILLWNDAHKNVIVRQVLEENAAQEVDA